MYGEPVHLSLGSCRYADFKPGDLVELSNHGWGAGLAVNYAYTIGRVVSFEKGILTVHREGVETPKEYHPCFWEKISEKRAKELRADQYKYYWLDHIPDWTEQLIIHEV